MPLQKSLVRLKKPLVKCSSLDNGNGLSALVGVVLFVVVVARAILTLPRQVKLPQPHVIRAWGSAALLRFVYASPTAKRCMQNADPVALPPGLGSLRLRFCVRAVVLGVKNAAGALECDGAPCAVHPLARDALTLVNSGAALERRMSKGRVRAMGSLILSLRRTIWVIVMEHGKLFLL